MHYKLFTDTLSQTIGQDNQLAMVTSLSLLSLFLSWLHLFTVKWLARQLRISSQPPFLAAEIMLFLSAFSCVFSITTIETQNIGMFLIKEVYALGIIGALVPLGPYKDEFDVRASIAAIQIVWLSGIFSVCYIAIKKLWV